MGEYFRVSWGCVEEYLGCLKGYFGGVWGDTLVCVSGDTLGYLWGVFGNMLGVWRDTLRCLGGYFEVYGGIH